jgi:hypothetical protein
VDYLASFLVVRTVQRRIRTFKFKLLDLLHDRVLTSLVEWQTYGTVSEKPVSGPRFETDSTRIQKRKANRYYTRSILEVKGQLLRQAYG